MTKLPERRVSKSKMAMYLRTLCDRELYLSLFSNNPKNLEAAGIPIPLKSRPGVQLITKSGDVFEHEQFDLLVSALPNNVIHVENGKKYVDLAASLAKVNKPTLILQPELEPEDFRQDALSALGVSSENIALLPAMSGMRPDVIFADERRESEFEVLPNGSRQRLPPDDKRMALVVVDLKNIAEANATYSAEVCLYAIFIANWLRSQGGELAKRFFVSDRVYLWRHVEMPRFTEVRSSREGQDHSKRLAALRADLEDGLVLFLIYMPAVRKFFANDLPRVLVKGDLDGWNSVDFHVNPRCSSCDWLGNRAWLSPEDGKHFDRHPEHYCSQNAETSDHLSKMPSLSKGASNVLSLSGHAKVAAVAGIDANDSVLRGHALLKRDRMQIGARATSIASNSVTVDNVSKVGGLAKRLGAEYQIIVNFDVGSGFLTGIALRGTLFAPYDKNFPAEKGGEAQSLKVLGEVAFVVSKDHLTAEWAALSAFIEKFGTWIEDTDRLFKTQTFGEVRTQIAFWEVRQYKELCNAFGRHLNRVLDLPVRTQRALAWLFPPDELMEKFDSVCPNIIFIRDIVSASLRLPQRFAVTLLGTATHYHHDRLTPRSIDSYYVEPLGNGIPRERIFEIWKTSTGTVRKFGRDISVADAIEQYGKVLRDHTWALASITARLRRDLRDCIEGDAPLLNMSIPTGLAGAAYDSRLWDRWSTVSNAAAKTEAMNAMITRAEWLEASYKAIILTKLVKDNGGGWLDFEVSDDSTEAKLEEGDDYCTLGIVDRPGFPLQNGRSLGLSIADNSQYRPMHSVVRVRIVAFLRAKKRITIQVMPRWDGVKAAYDAVMKSGIVPIGTGQLYILEGAPYDDSRAVTDILRVIGNPPIAAPAKETLAALGVTASKKIAKGKDNVTAPATVLWSADNLAGTVVRNDAEVKSLVDFAKTANPQPLNASQIVAVTGCAKARLTIVWGPPGTGKTQTLVAFLHALVREGRARNILIAGPNYRAVEELADRLTSNLIGDDKATCDFFWLYSKNREPKALPTPPKHLVLKAARRDNGSAEYGELKASLAKSNRTTIVSTTAHIVDGLTINALEAPVAELFDVVILDESSQIPVTLALRPLSALKSNGQLVVAGDQKQMPPIRALDAPKNAEHLVDSVQTYLIERFKINPAPLLVNYRSNQDVVDFAKTLGYPEGLKANTPKKDIRLLRPLKDVIATIPTTLPSTSAYEALLMPERRVTALVHEDTTSSQANELEAGLVAALAFVLRHAAAQELDLGARGSGTAFTDDAFFREGIGIVTPHKAQKALVLRKLIELFPSADPELVFSAVDTVERFQGSERDTIIVSYGVGDTDIIEGEEEFLLQLERTNVAVSRARAKCIVLMPNSLAYHLPTDIKAAETSVALKSYLEEFCSNRVIIDIQFDKKTKAGEVRWH